MTDQYEAFAKSGITLEDKSAILPSVSKALERDVRRYPQNLTGTGDESYAERK